MGLKVGFFRVAIGGRELTGLLGAKKPVSGALDFSFNGRSGDASTMIGFSLLVPTFIELSSSLIVITVSFNPLLPVQKTSGVAEREDTLVGGDVWGELWVFPDLLEAWLCGPSSSKLDP